jgi:quercetin dioxygenase-like cupin family protein
MMHQRRIFLSTIGAGLGSLALPVTASPQAAETGSPRVVRATDVKPMWVLGIMLTVHTGSETTGGGYAVTSDYVLPGQGVPMHVHTREDEAIYVVDGEVTITIGDLQQVARPGDVAHMPRNVAHRFQNTSDRPARIVLVFTPGGIEGLFREVGKPVSDPSEHPPAITAADIAAARNAAERYGARWM